MEAATSTETSRFRIHPGMRLGEVVLAVADLERMTHFYETIIGLRRLASPAGQSRLGVDGVVLVRLVHRPGGRAEPGATGLYHLALLLPSREALGAWLGHLAESGYRLDGAGDHGVSEALYLSDPEGNGIEIYRDRPRTEWEYVRGQLIMGTDRVDLRSLLDDAHGASWHGMPAGTTMGHVHLRVSHSAATGAFFDGVMGMDTMAAMPGAGFFSAGGYHHHIGANTWQSRGARPPSAQALGLISCSLILPDATSRDTLTAHIESSGIGLDRAAPDPVVRDPSGNALVLTVA